MARKVWLHVGCPKTGTSFLQSVMWANKAALKEQGLLVPRSQAHHWRASLYVRGAHQNRPHSWRFAVDWRDLVNAVRRARGDVLISHELFAPATPAQARQAIEAFGGAETHVIITARDLARQIPAGWQQSVKHGATHRLDEFVQDVVHKGPRARTFWRMQNLVRVAARWGDSLPPERVHLVTVPAGRSDPAELWRRFASVPGIDPDSVELQGASRNDSLGAVEVELMRRLNECRPDKGRGNVQNHLFKDMLADELLAARPGKQKFAIDASVHPWVVETAHAMVSSLKERGYDVAGDLGDLIPPEQPESGVDVARTSDQELLAAATQTIVDLVERQRSTAGRDERLRHASAGAARGLHMLGTYRPWR
jgi:hypothetical protein